ncbi:radical SAM family heme chaperone HemW [bacterium]|nr:radical SAM family heme chaperone HemW [bacterium]
MSLYIHIPFCSKKCFYCSFAIFIGNEQHIDLYLRCLKKEIRQYKKKKVKSVYIGGGTPTFLNGRQLEKLFNIIKEKFYFKDTAEITIEANPEDLTLDKLKLIKQLGINRFSLGVQTFSDKYLKMLGRNHNVECSVKAYENIRRAGFENINLDLIYGFDGQTLKELESDVKDICRLGSEHLSLYTLGIEKNSNFFTKKIQVPDNQSAAKQYLLVKKIVKQYGFRQYEVSNFAKSKKKSTHNLNYWQGGDYIGLGMGAHSHIKARRFWNTDKFFEYTRMMEDQGFSMLGEERLKNKERLIEALLFGLRMNKGVNVERLEKKYSCRIDCDRQKKIDYFISRELLVKKGDVLKVTQSGQLLLDELSSRLI